MVCILTLQVKLDPYLLINGGVASSRGHPHLLIEAIADGIRQVDAGVSVRPQDRPATKQREATNTYAVQGQTKNTSL